MKKPQILIILIMVIFCLLIFLGVTLKKLSITYIVFSDNNNLIYDNGWKVISNDELPNFKYSITSDGELLFTSKLKIMENSIYAGNTEILGENLVYRGNVKNINYEISTLDNDDINYLNGILNNKNIFININDLTYTYKYLIDLNNDSIKEVVYSISNYYDTDLALFSLVIVNKEIIEFDTFESEYDSYIPYIYFIDFKKDKFSDIIIKNTYSSLVGQNIKILSYNKNLEYEIQEVI